MTADDRAAAMGALAADLERRFRTTTTTVDLGRRAVEILHPANADDLISEADYVRDERLPYWADLWPAAIVLARRMAASASHGRSLLELGCGSGLAAVGSALAGYRVTATDYYDDAVLFARLNVWRNVGAEAEARMVNWQELPADLGAFDVIIASDVLYEPRYPPLVANAIERALAPRGVAIIADPGRMNAPAFADECHVRGLRAEIVEQIPFEAGPVKQTVDIWEAWRIRARA